MAPQTKSKKSSPEAFNTRFTRKEEKTLPSHYPRPAVLTLSLALLAVGGIFSTAAASCTETRTAAAGSGIESMDTATTGNSPTVCAHRSETLRTYVPPHIETNVSVHPDVVWPENGKGMPKNATLTLTVEGAGGPAIAFRPQDTIFVIDCSQTMRYISDPNDLRLLAARHYVDNMIPPDRCTVVRFSSGAELVNNHPLTSNYTQVQEDIDSLNGSAAGQTNFQAAFDNATGELEKDGSAAHMWIEIFITDGRPEPAGTNITAATMGRIKANNITVFTIGLGLAQDRSLLKWIANETGGRYYDAPNASALDDIYLDIANQFKDYTASYGGELYYVLPDTVHYQNGTISNTTGNITCSITGTTTFTWSMPKMMLGDGWNASLNVSSTGSGWVSLGVLPDSRVDYRNWNHTWTFTMFPDRKLWVIPEVPAPPPMPIPPPTPVTPMPVPPPALMAPVSQAAVTIQPIFSLTSVGQATGISTAELIAPFAALGLGNFARVKRKVKTKRTIDIGVRDRNKTPEELAAAEKKKRGGMKKTRKGMSRRKKSAGEGS
jgi:hypothetical protein